MFSAALSALEKALGWQLALGLLCVIVELNFIIILSAALGALGKALEWQLALGLLCSALSWI